MTRNSILEVGKKCDEIRAAIDKYKPLQTEPANLNPYSDHTSRDLYSNHQSQQSTGKFPSKRVTNILEVRSHVDDLQAWHATLVAMNSNDTVEREITSAEQLITRMHTKLCDPSDNDVECEAGYMGYD